MSSSGNFESKITLKTQLDTAGVIQGLRQIQQQLQAQAKVNPANFTEINEKLKEAEKKAEELQKLSKVGLTSTKDVERMRALTESFNTLIKAASKLTSSEIKTGFDDAIRKIEKEASTATEKLNEELNKIRLEFRKGVMDAGGNKALLSDLKDLRKKGVEYGEAVNAALKPLNNSLDEMSSRIQALNAQIVTETATLKRLQDEAATARTNVTTVTNDVKAKLDIAASTRDSNIKNLRSEDANDAAAYTQRLKELARARVDLLKEQLRLSSLIQKSQQFISQNSESNFTIAGQKVNPFNVTSKLAGFYNSQVLGNEVNNLIKELAGEITSIFKKVGGGPWSAKDRNTLANALISSVLSSSNTAAAMTSFLGTKIGGKNSESFKHLTKQTTIGNALLTGSLETKTDVEEIIQKWFERMPLAQAQQEELARQQALKENQESLQKNKDALNANKEAVSNLTTQVKEVKETREKQKKALEEAISTEESTYKKTKEEQEKRIKEAEAEAKRAEAKPKAQQTKIDTLTGEQARIQASYDTQKQKIEGLNTVLRSQQMTALYNEAIQKSKELSDQEKQTKEAIDALNRSRDEANKKIQNQNALLKASTNELYKELKATQSLTTVQAKVNKNFDQVINTILYRFSALSIIRTASRIIKQTFNDIQKLDKAFGSIAMVTSMSLNQLWGQYSQYATIANRLGQQTQSAIEASALYYQQGLQTVDVLKLTESTMKLATLAGQNFSEATKEMTAAIRAFHMEMSEGERITDVYSELAAHAAADVSGIATAMSKVASIAASSGAKFENISAFLTQIIETTQEAPSNAGTALKTVIARFSELKEEVDETDTETPYNKMDTALKSVGISLRDEIGQIRAFDEVILELGGIWGTLSRNQQRYIATTAAGSRQQSRFLALMENNKRLLELIDVAEESSGKSQLQFDKYADTIEYRINKLKNTWERFRVSIFGSEAYKKALGYVNLLLERITKMTTTDLLTLGATFTLIGKTAAKGFLNGFKGTAAAVLQFFTGIGLRGEMLLSNMFGVGNSAKTGKIATSLIAKGTLFDQNGNVSPEVPLTEWQGLKINNLLNSPVYSNGKITGLTEDQQNTLKNYFTQMDAMAAQRGQAYGNTFAIAALSAITSYSIRNQPGNVFVDVLKTGLTSSALQSVSVFSQALVTSGSALTALASGGTVAGISAIITVAIAGITSGIKAWQQYKERVAEANAMQYEFYRSAKAIGFLQEDEEKLQERLAETTNTYEQRKEEFEDILEKGNQIKELQNKILLTNEEKDELVKLSTEIATLAPELVSGYDAEGVAIINLTSNYEQLIEAKRKAYAESRIQVAEESAQLAENQYQQTVLQKSLYESLQEYTKNNQVFENIKTGKTRQPTVQTGNENAGYIASTTAIGGVMGGLPGLGIGTIAGLIMAGINTYQSTLDDMGDWLRENNSPEMQQALKEIFKDSAAFDVSDKNGKDIVKSIADTIDESKGNLDLFNKEIENFVNSSKDSEKAITEAFENVKKASRELVTANLQLNPDYINANSATQQAMVRYGAYKSDVILNVQKLTKAADTYRAMGLSLGMSDEKLEEYVQVHLQQYQDNLNKRIQNLDYSAIVNTNWEQFAEETANLPLNEAASILIEKLGESDEQVLAWIADNKQGIEAANKKAEELAEVFGLTLKRELDNQVLTFDDDNELGLILEQVGIVVWDRLISGLQDAKKSGKDKEFIETYKAMAKDVSEEDLKELLNIQWENYTIFDSNEIQEKVSQEGQKWLDTLEKLMWNQDFSAEGMIEDIKAHIEALQKEGPYAAIEKALTTQFKEGYIDTASLKALSKAKIPLDKLYNDDATINREAAEKYAKQLTEENINQALALKQQYKQKTEILKTALLELKATSQVTAELYKQQLIKGGLGSREIAAEVERFEKNNLSLTKLEDQIKAREEAEPEFLKYIESLVGDYKALYLNMMNRIAEAWTKQQEEEEEAAKQLEDMAKEVADAYDDIIKKQESLAEAQKKLNDTLYGSETRKSSLDDLYNYQTALDALNASIEEIKENLEDFEGSPKELINQLFSATRNKAVYLGAENDRYNAAINSTYNSLLGQVNRYMKTIGGGANYDTSNFFLYNPLLDRYEIDQAAINSAKVNDDFKGFIENQIDLMNQYKKNIQNNNKEIKKTEKDLEDYRKKARDSYVSVEEEVVKKLKEFYEKQVDDKKEMYDALSEADNEYLDALQKAIDKQRKLRDQQDKWNELSTKEKRLSLIQRDTSGANRKDIQKLQKEIQKDRTSMLDTSVDNIVNNLKEMYELQKESREDELKYQEAIIENANYVAEANAIMQSWKSLDDMRAWMYEHTKNIEDMSDASVEKLSDDWEKMFNSIQVYNELSKKKIEENFENTGNEIQKVIFNTTESLTGEASRAFKEIQNSVDKAIERAKDSVTDAMKALADAQEKYNKLLKKENELIKEKKRQEDLKSSMKGIVNDLPIKTKKSEKKVINKELEDELTATNPYTAYQGPPLPLSDEEAEKARTRAWQQAKDIVTNQGTGGLMQLLENYDSYIAQSIIKQILEKALGDKVLSDETILDILSSGGIYKGDKDFYTLASILKIPYALIGQEAYWSLDENALDNMLRAEAPSFKGNVEKHSGGTYDFFNLTPDMLNKEFFDPLGQILYNNLFKYEKGGLVDYTGPAWVDGTKNRPEAFLTSEDTMRIGQAANILRDLVSYSRATFSNATLSPNVRESNTEIHIHVDSIATESQVDYLIDRVKEEIVDAANPIGSSVILH